MFTTYWKIFEKHTFCDMSKFVLMLNLLKIWQSCSDIYGEVTQLEMKLTHGI